MRTFFEQTSGELSDRWTMLRARMAHNCGLRGEDGFLLIEVIVSAMLVAIIVVGTFTGFDDVNRASTADRQHDQAILLASASQEQLRSDPASVLQTLEASPHAYSKTIGGTVYSISQGAELQPASGSTAACSANNSSRQSSNAYRVTSTVTWATQQSTKRPAVVASSLVTPPIGSGLEVDAINAPAGSEGMPNITALVKFTPEGSTGLTTESGSTSSEGCVLFGDIPASEADIEIEEIPGYVTPAGKKQVQPNPKEETLAPNYTTHYTVVYNHAGAIEAKYRYNGAESAKHANNEGTGEVTQTVTGDTFVALNTGMEEAPNFEIGATKYGTATATTYTPTTGEYLTHASTPMNLFPFLETESYWSVYAGDCSANNPETVTGNAVKISEKVVVKPGLTTSTTVPTSYTTLNVYNKKESEVAKASKPYQYLETTTSYPVLIDNLGCASTTPNNETSSYKHAQTTSTGSSIGGHLSYPFQPFGKEFTMCLVSSALGRTYKVKYANTAAAGGSVSIYLPQRPTSEVIKERQTEESAYKAKETEYKSKETEYKSKESTYKSRESEYKSKETAYKTKETEYKTEKSKYESTHNNTYKTKYETDKTEYEKLKSEYEKLKSEYEKYKGEYETAKKESVTDKEEFENDKEGYEAAKAEEKEGTSVTVEKSTVCT